MYEANKLSHEELWEAVAIACIPVKVIIFKLITYPNSFNVKIHIIKSYTIKCY